MQKTNFKFVAIVHDDASTDKTAEIISEYAEKYPEIIMPIYETENQYSKHDGSLKRIMDNAIDSIGAKYVALCEGDDYWTDPFKLQKQVNFLESHQDYSMCFHAARIVLEGVDKSKIGARCEKIVEKRYDSSELFNTWIVPTAAIVYNKEKYKSFHLSHRDWLTRGDIATVLTCAHVGLVWGMREQMSVYRMQPNSVSYNPSIRDKEIYRLANHFKCLYYNFPEVDRSSLTWCISNAYYGRMKAPNRNMIQRVSDFLSFVVWNPSYAIGKMWSLLWKKLKYE